MCGYECHGTHMEQRTLTGVSFLFLPRRAWRSHSGGGQAWQQALYPPSHLTSVFTKLLFWPVCACCVTCAHAMAHMHIYTHACSHVYVLTLLPPSAPGTHQVWSASVVSSGAYFLVGFDHSVMVRGDDRMSEDRESVGPLFPPLSWPHNEVKNKSSDYKFMKLYSNFIKIFTCWIQWFKEIELACSVLLYQKAGPGLRWIALSLSGVEACGCTAR